MSALQFKIQDLIKELENIQTHISDSQGGELKSLLDESKKPAPIEGALDEEALESPREEELEDGTEKPVIASSDEDKMPGEEEMTDEELEELAKRYSR